LAAGGAAPTPAPGGGAGVCSITSVGPQAAPAAAPHRNSTLLSACVRGRPPRLAPSPGRAAAGKREGRDTGEARPQHPSARNSCRADTPCEPLVHKERVRGPCHQSGAEPARAHRVPQAVRALAAPQARLVHVKVQAVRRAAAPAMHPPLSNDSRLQAAPLAQQSVQVTHCCLHCVARRVSLLGRRLFSHSGRVSAHAQALHRREHVPGHNNRRRRVLRGCGSRARPKRALLARGPAATLKAALLRGTRRYVLCISLLCTPFHARSDEGSSSNPRFVGLPAW